MAETEYDMGLIEEATNVFLRKADVKDTYATRYFCDNIPTMLIHNEKFPEDKLIASRGSRKMLIKILSERTDKAQKIIDDLIEKIESN